VAADEKALGVGSASGSTSALQPLTRAPAIAIATRPSRVRIGLTVASSSNRRFGPFRRLCPQTPGPLAS
jgi:hypothetical protein